MKPGRLEGRAWIRVFRDLPTAPFDGTDKNHTTLSEFKINSGERTFQDIDGRRNQAYELLKGHLLIRSDYYRTLDISGKVSR
ncbi:hypothetical protein [Rhizobium sp. RCC_161_2]|uniref:hypothetical protein n=1 Tax=Rhizobium sp. RCC_161_2 TaxID=3239219 RepID=UPI003523EEB0